MNIVVLNDQTLPTHSWSAAIMEQLEGTTSTVIQVTVADLADALAHADIFLSVHGGTYPIEIEDALLSFLGRGGGLLHVGEMPFEQTVEYREGAWHPVVRTLGDLRDHAGHGPLQNPIDAFRARLGFLAYATPTETGAGLTELAVDPMFLGDLHIPISMPVAGLDLSTSIPIHSVRPDLKRFDHRAYQARPTGRAAHTAGWVVGSDGMPVASVLLSVKTWRNPYAPSAPGPHRPYAIFTAEPTGAYPDEILAPMLRWLECPCFFLPVDLPLATLHEGEHAVVSAQLTAPMPEGWRVVAQLATRTAEQIAAGDPVHWQDADTGSSASLLYRSDALLSSARFILIDGEDSPRDVVEVSAVCVHPDSLDQGPRIVADGRYFAIDVDGQTRRSTWLAGTNWQDRFSFAFTWDNPDPFRIASDAAAMARAGVEIVRPHFFHPGWFGAVPAGVYGVDDPAFAGRFDDGPELSERHIRAFEAHLVVFTKFGIALHPSLYTNLPPTMGNPSHWIGTSRLFVLEPLIEAQEGFARQMMDRFGRAKGIVWDLDNEPDTAMHEAGVWLARHADTWGATGHALGVGVSSIADDVLLGERADWHSVHGSLRQKADVFVTGKPTLLQEAHNPAPTTAVGERDQSLHLTRAITWTLRHGGAGVLPWNWNMSRMNWRWGGGWVDFWDLELGTAVHADGTRRRSFSTMRDWAALLQGVGFDQSGDQVGYVYPRRFLAGMGGYEYLTMLGDLRIPVRALNDSDEAAWDLSGIKLVILPHAAAGFSRASLNRLRAFASDGGVVWAHNDTVLLDQDGARHQLPWAPPPVSKIEHIGEGRFIWTVGWNYDDHPSDNSIPIDLVPMLGLLNDLELRRVDDRLPLADGGEIRFVEHLAVGEHSMVSDWQSDVPIPDQRIVDEVMILNSRREVVRGWSSAGSLDVARMSLTANGELFVLRSTDVSVLVSTSGDRLMFRGPVSGVRAHVVRGDARALRTGTALRTLVGLQVRIGRVLEIEIPARFAGEWLWLSWDS